MVVDELVDAVSVYGKRSLRIVTRLVDMHLDLAQRELALEQRRLTSASVSLALGASLFMSGLVLAQVLGLLWLYQTQERWLLWSLALIGGNIGIGGLLLVGALQRLRGPYMQETLAQLAKTASVLTQDEYDDESTNG